MFENASQLQPEIVEWRRHIHAHPELSFQEHETSAYIRERLVSFGLQPQQLTETGLFADIEGRRVGNRVAVRADIDALPIEEATGLPFASRNPGVMHACGHDGHTAIALGVAKIAARDRDFDGTFRVFFQPAEEHPPGGAVKLIEAGVLDGCSAAIGLHILSDIPAGIIAIRNGAIMANSDNFTVRVLGRGGHASQPNRGVDPVMVASHLVVNLQTIVSRSIDPIAPGVVTVGTIHGGTTHNVIPDDVTISGTCRSFDPFTREEIRARLERISRETCAMFGAECEFEYVEGYPAVVNHAGTTAVIDRVARRVVGDERVIKPPRIMGGEDFSRYAEKIPASFFFLGGGREGEARPHHHPSFDFEESVLWTGVRVLGESALELARKS